MERNRNLQNIDAEIAMGMQIGDMIDSLFAKLETSKPRPQETVYVDCTLCNENKPGTVKDDIAICDDCHRDEVA